MNGVVDVMLCQVEREGAGRIMPEKQFSIVENTLKAEEAKVRHYAAEFNNHQFSVEAVQRNDGRSCRECLERQEFEGKSGLGRVERAKEKTANLVLFSCLKVKRASK